MSAGKPITPIEIATAEENSAYWRATEQGTVKTALFFLKAAQPDHLADAPGGQTYLTADAAALAKGREVFANTCARCHSSKSPQPPEDLGLVDCNGPNYMQCFKKWWAWTQTDDYKTKMRAIVEAPDFLDRQLPVDRRAHPGDLAADQRVQPAGDQCARGQYLERLLLDLLQDAAVGRFGDVAGPVRRPQLELRR